ncbi:hypothetical protein BGX27_011139 [Mortierella sp. AM989]|nr:hypothetical protein BGX27_011139 [Mortierella sp. AM989]
MGVSKGKEVYSSVLDSPSAQAKRRKAVRETFAAAELGSEPTSDSLEAPTAVQTEGNQGNTSTGDQSKEEEEEVDQEEEKEEAAAASEHSDQESPFLVAHHSQENILAAFPDLTKPGIKRLTDIDVGLNTQTPTRPRIRGKPINLFRHGRQITRSMHIQRDDLVELDQYDVNGALPLKIIKIKPSGMTFVDQNLDVAGSSKNGDQEKEDTYDKNDNVSDDDSNNDNADIEDEDEDDTISLPKTPSKPRQRGMIELRSLTPSESGSPSTPGSWLSRWKYNIMMSHSSMKPPNLSEEDEDDGSPNISVMSSLDVESPDQNRLLTTPKRKRTNLLIDSQLLNSITVQDESSVNESSDYETLVTPVKQGVKRRPDDGDDNYGYEYSVEDDQEEEKEDGATNTDAESGSSDDKEQLRLDFKSLERLPFTPTQQRHQLQSSSPFYTPPSKRLSSDLSNIKPPRAPVLSAGKLPMFRTQGFSNSPSQHRQRPLSHLEPPSFDTSK